jgi:hypothetical protein
MAIRLSIPVVINTSYGGFGLSEAAALELMRRKGLTCRRDSGYLVVGETGCQTVEDIVPRDDQDLIEVVRIMGDIANGDRARLAVSTVEIRIVFENYDGKERIVVSGWLT